MAYCKFNWLTAIHIASFLAKILLWMFCVVEYVALYNYNGSAGDLSFKAGDVIEVRQMTGEWWTGTIGDRQGIFPANYVKKKKKHGSGAAVKNKTPSYQAATLPAIKRPGWLFWCYDSVVLHVFGYCSDSNCGSWV
jgi:hypothetical protein